MALASACPKMMKRTLYAKTPLAWEALSRPDAVDRDTHALLLMANGRRSVHELCVLLGKDISVLAYELAGQGYLKVVLPPSSPPDEEPHSGFTN
jgi:hypothetical protein